MRALARLAKLKSILDARSRWIAGMPAWIAHIELVNRLSPLRILLNFLL